MKNTLETLISTRDLANLFGLSSRRIRQLCEERVLPAPAAGKFKLREAVSAYITDLRARKDSKTLMAVRTRRTEAQARLAECEADLAERKTVLVADVIKWGEGAFVAIRAKILASGLSVEEQDDLLLNLRQLRTADLFNYDKDTNTTNKPAADFTAAAGPQPQQANQAHQ